jgi:hypothetical protein
MKPMSATQGRALLKRSASQSGPLIGHIPPSRSVIVVTDEGGARC